MAYEKKFVNPYPDGWIDLPEEETPVDAEAMQKITDGIEGIDNYLSENPPDELKESLTQYEQIVDDAIEGGYISPTINDTSDVVVGYYNYQTGQKVYDVGTVRCDNKISVEPNTKYTFKKLNGNFRGNVWILAFKDENTLVNDASAVQGYNSALARVEPSVNEIEFTTTPTTKLIVWYSFSTDITPLPKVSIRKYCPSNTELNESLTLKTQIVTIDGLTFTFRKCGKVKSLELSGSLTNAKDANSTLCTVPSDFNTVSSSVIMREPFRNTRFMIRDGALTNLDSMTTTSYFGQTMYF